MSRLSDGMPIHRENRAASALFLKNGATSGLARGRGDAREGARLYFEGSCRGHRENRRVRDRGGPSPAELLEIRR